MNSEDTAGHRLNVQRKIPKVADSNFTKQSREKTALLLAHLPFLEDIESIRAKYGIPEGLTREKDEYEEEGFDGYMLAGSWWREAHLTEEQERGLWEDINAIPKKYGYLDEYWGLVDSLVMYGEASDIPIVGASTLVKIPGKSGDIYMFNVYGNLSKREAEDYLNEKYGKITINSHTVKESKKPSLDYAEINSELLFFKVYIPHKSIIKTKTLAATVSSISADYFKPEKSLVNPERDYRIYWDYTVENKSYAEVAVSEWEFTLDDSAEADIKRGYIVRKASERFAEKLAKTLGVTQAKT